MSSSRSSSRSAARSAVAVDDPNIMKAVMDRLDTVEQNQQLFLTEIRDTLERNHQTVLSELRKDGSKARGSATSSQPSSPATASGVVVPQDNNEDDVEERLSELDAALARITELETEIARLNGNGNVDVDVDVDVDVEGSRTDNSGASESSENSISRRREPSGTATADASESSQNANTASRRRRESSGTVTRASSRRESTDTTTSTRQELSSQRHIMFGYFDKEVDKWHFEPLQLQLPSHGRITDMAMVQHDSWMCALILKDGKVYYANIYDGSTKKKILENPQPFVADDEDDENDDVRVTQIHARDNILLIFREDVMDVWRYNGLDFSCFEENFDATLFQRPFGLFPRKDMTNVIGWSESDTRTLDCCYKFDWEVSNTLEKLPPGLSIPGKYEDFVVATGPEAKLYYVLLRSPDSSTLHGLKQNGKIELLDPETGADQILDVAANSTHLFFCTSDGYFGCCTHEGIDDGPFDHDDDVNGNGFFDVKLNDVSNIACGGTFCVGTSPSSLDVNILSPEGGLYVEKVDNYVDRNPERILFARASKDYVSYVLEWTPHSDATSNDDHASRRRSSSSNQPSVERDDGFEAIVNDDSFEEDDPNNYDNVDDVAARSPAASRSSVNARRDRNDASTRRISSSSRISDVSSSSRHSPGRTSVEEEERRPTQSSRDVSDVSDVMSRLELTNRNSDRQSQGRPLQDDDRLSQRGQLDNQTRNVARTPFEPRSPKGLASEELRHLLTVVGVPDEDDLVLHLRIDPDLAEFAKTSKQDADQRYNLSVILYFAGLFWEDVVLTDDEGIHWLIIFQIGGIDQSQWERISPVLTNIHVKRHFRGTTDAKRRSWFERLHRDYPRHARNAIRDNKLPAGTPFPPPCWYESLSNPFSNLWKNNPVAVHHGYNVTKEDIKRGNGDPLATYNGFKAWLEVEKRDGEDLVLGEKLKRFYYPLEDVLDEYLESKLDPYDRQVRNGA